MAKFGAPTVSSVIAQIANNDPKITEVDFTGQAVFQMKSDEKICELCAALEQNTHVVSLKLKDCAISDSGADVLGDMLTRNSFLSEVDLSDNPALKEDGGIALAKGLKTNHSLSRLDLMGMPVLGKSEKVLRAFIDMYEQNITLRKIVWRLDHPLAHTLARLATRNNSIFRRQSQGKPFDDLAPESIRAPLQEASTPPPVAEEPANQTTAE